MTKRLESCFQMDNLPEGVDMSDITNNILPNDPNTEEPNG